MADEIRLKIDILRARLAVAAEIEKAKGGKGPTDQPRHPAGSPLGGQFAPSKGAGGAAGGSQGGSGGSKGGPQVSQPSWVKSWLDTFMGGGSASSGKSGGGGMFPGETPGYFGGMKQPTEPAHTKPSSAKAVLHQAADDKGRKVYIQHPSKPTEPSTWTNPAATATFIPGGKAPTTLNGIPMKKWEGVDDWTKVPGQRPDLEAGLPDLAANKWKHPAAGVIIEEPDGRVWLTTPTNHYGGYRNTYPKGTQEPGLTLQQTAIKEAWEETGLKIEITGVLGDFERSTSVSRFYTARRVGGTPTDQGWESQAIRLTPPSQLKSLLNMKVDRDILDALIEERDIDKSRDLIPEGMLAQIAARIDAVSKAAKGAGGGGPKKGGAWETQPRWPGGSPLGGQWKSYDSAGLVKPPSIGTPTNQGQQNKANAAYNLASLGSWGPVGEALAVAEGKIKAFGVSYPNDGSTPIYGKAPNSQAKWNQSLHQYLHGLIMSKHTAQAVTAKADRLVGPDKLSDYKKIGEMSAGSNPKAIYIDKNGTKVLVKGANTPSDDRAKNEVLAAKLMQAAGIGAPDMKLVDLQGAHGGGLGVASAMVPLTGWSSSNKSDLAAAQSEFAVHAWLANYDAVGQPVGDNLGKGPNGQIFNYDPGGALLYRAQGKPKPLPGGMLAHTADEWQGMRNPAINAHAASVYGSMTDSQLKESAKKVAAVSDQTIKDLVSTYGPGDEKKKAALAAALIARRDDIVAKAGLSPAALAAEKPATQGATLVTPGEKPDMVANPPAKGAGLLAGGALGGAAAASAQPTPVASKTATGYAYSAGMTNTLPGHNKFYTLAVQENSDGTATLTKTWGAIGGKSPMSKVESYGSVATAVTAAKIVAGQKAGKGYVYDSDLAPKAPLSAAAPKKAADMLSKTTTAAVIDAAGQMVSGGLDTNEKATFSKFAEQIGFMQTKLDAGDKAGAEAAYGAVVHGLKAIEANPGNSLGQAKAAFLAAAQGVGRDLGLKLPPAPTPPPAASPKPADDDKLPDLVVSSLKAAETKALDGLKADQIGIGSNLGNAFQSIGFAHQTMLSTGGQMSPDEQEKFKNYLADAAKLLDKAESQASFPTGAFKAVAAYHGEVMNAAALKLDDLPDVAVSLGVPAAGKKAVTAAEVAQKPDFISDGAYAGTAKYYTNLADKMEAAFNAGDAAGLAALGQKNAKGKQPWPKKDDGSATTANGKKIEAYHGALMVTMGALKQDEAAEALQPVTPVPSGGRKGSAAALPNIEAAKIPTSNSNAASHNSKLDTLKKLADAGDVKGILALNYGTNTYGKKQAKIANDVLAALGSPYTVDPGQKKGSHPALVAAGPAGDHGSMASMAAQSKATAALKPSELPPKVDFTGKSSKVWVNEANQKHYDALSALALAGDFAGVKNYQFDEISKETGQPTGKKIPISQHPSQHITNHVDYLLQQMDEKLNPPKPLEIFEAKMAADSVAKLAAKFTPAKLGSTSKQFPSSQKLGHFIALGQVANPEKLKPAKVKDFSSVQVSQAFADHKVWGNDPDAEAFRQLIQGHGGHEYHKGFDLSTAEGKKRLAQAKAAHKYARKQPAGTQVYKWENLSADAAAKLQNAKPGLIIQNPAPTCCSYSSTATKGFGPSHRWNIIFSDGAKGFNSFGSGAFSGEKEVTMLPNHRFMVLEHKPKGPNGHAETTVLLLPPDPDLDSNYWD